MAVEMSTHIFMQPPVKFTSRQIRRVIEISFQVRRPMQEIIDQIHTMIIFEYVAITIIDAQKAVNTPDHYAALLLNPNTLHYVETKLGSDYQPAKQDLLNAAEHLFTQARAKVRFVDLLHAYFREKTILSLCKLKYEHRHIFSYDEAVVIADGLASDRILNFNIVAIMGCLVAGKDTILRDAWEIVERKIMQNYDTLKILSFISLTLTMQQICETIKKKYMFTISRAKLIECYIAELNNFTMEKIKPILLSPREPLVLMSAFTFISNEAYFKLRDQI